MLQFNKGEWSEPYCLLKIMADKKLFLCNSGLLETGDHIHIVGGNIADGIDYKLCDDVINITFGNENKKYSTPYIKELLSSVLKEINKKQPRTFPIPDLEKFFFEIGSPSFKSKSTNKADCTISVFDDILQSNENLGFSIKSFLAGSPTLINASKATNFTYEVNSADKKFTALKTKTLLRHLKKDEIAVKYKGMDSNIYQKNLMLIDTQMPVIVSELLKIYFSSKIKNIADIVELLKKNNPLNLDNTSLYQNKVKDFLFFSATGMFPNTGWEGVQNVDGGCLIVKNNGEVSAFYIFRKKFLVAFREYLYLQCFLDTASTTRHVFGKLYQENNLSYLKLNLQIRIQDN